VDTARLVFQFGAAVNVALGCRIFRKTPRANNSAQLKQFGAQNALSRDFLLRSEAPKIDASSRHTESPKFNSENNIQTNK
jgi:hypothetical protein